ncbi:MAG: transposase [Treponema sp.]|jgi:transposase|nr:transposase [Treponema sp.]
MYPSHTINRRGTGDEQYPPVMMLELLVYCYITGTFGSRRIQQATYTDVAVRYICGGKAYPEFSVICAFRRENQEAFKEAFIKVLGIAQETGHLKKLGNISVDGTKIKTNAGKHKAVSYEYAKKQLEVLEGEVKELIAKAEEADSKPLEEGLPIAEEIGGRKGRQEKLEAAKREIEARYEEVRKGEQAAYEAKMAARAAKEQRTGWKPPRPPSAEPPGNSQYNFTDPESRIMKAGNGQHFEQAYNRQAAVDVDTMLIVGEYVTNRGNDKQELKPAVNSAGGEVTLLRRYVRIRGITARKR